MTTIAGLLLAVATVQEADTLRAAWGAPEEIDPHRAVSLAEARLVAALYEGLVTYDADGVTPLPGMAKSWSVGDDGLTWTFSIRAAKWSNGDPVVAGDFVRSWRRAIAPSTGCRFRSLFRVFAGADAWMDAAEADAILAVYDDQTASRQAELKVRLARIARKRHVPALRRRGLPEAADAAGRRPDIAVEDLGFRAPDPATLVVRLVRRTPYLPDLLGFMTFVPLPSGALAKAWKDRPVNGPYIPGAATPAGIVLRRNPAYWDGEAKARPGRIKVSFLGDPLKNAGKDGVDWIAGERLPEGEVKGAVAYDTWGTYFLRLNVGSKPLDDPRMRKALARAIDRSAVARAVGRTPVARLVPSGCPGYPEVSAPGVDRGAAMGALLEATGFDTSKFPRLEIIAPDAAPFVESGTVIRKELEKTLGIEVRLRVMRPPAYFAAVAEGRYQVAFGAWMGDALDPVTFLEAWRKADPANTGGWSGAEFEDLVREARETGEAGKRLEMLSRAESILLADGAVIPLFASGDRMWISGRVSGLHANPMNRFPLKHVRLR